MWSVSRSDRANFGLFTLFLDLLLNSIFSFIIKNLLSSLERSYDDRYNYKRNTEPREEFHAHLSS